MGGNVLINGGTAVHAGPDVCRAGDKCRADAFTNRARSGDASGTGTVREGDGS